MAKTARRKTPRKKPTRRNLFGLGDNGKTEVQQRTSELRELEIRYGREVSAAKKRVSEARKKQREDKSLLGIARRNREQAEAARKRGETLAARLERQRFAEGRREFRRIQAERRQREREERERLHKTNKERIRQLLEERRRKRAERSGSS